MRRKLTFITLVVTVLLGAGLFSRNGLSRNVAGAQGESLQHRPCHLADLTGKYAYQASGTYGTNPYGIPVGTQFTATALLTVNADGTYATTGWQSLGGATSSATSTGTVTTVNANCTVRAIDSGGVVEYYLVIADGGKELKIMAISPGIIISGEAKRL